MNLKQTNTIPFLLVLSLLFSPLGALPTPEEWRELNDSIRGRLIHAQPNEMRDFLNEKLNNPFVIQEYPWGMQSVGWLNAWSLEMSPYIVAAQDTQDIVSAVKFARKHRLRL